jgi:hypothetical protein
MSVPLALLLDAWLRFDSDDEDEAAYEANVFVTEYYDRYDRADLLRFDVEWFHTAVGQVTVESFGTYEQAREWLTSAGYQDFTTEPIIDHRAWLEAHDYDGADNVGPLTLADGYLNEGSPTCGCCGVSFIWSDLDTKS